MIRSIGRTELRVVVALLVVGLLPLFPTIWLANRLVARVVSIAFEPDVGQQLDHSLGLYAELVQSMKKRMRSDGARMALDAELQQAVADEDEAATRAAIERLVNVQPDVLTVTLADADDEVLAEAKRKAPLDETVERPFTVQVPLAKGPLAEVLTVVFAADRRRVDEMEDAQAFVQGWKSVAEKHPWAWVERPYLVAIVLLLSFVVALAVITGVLLVRPATRRINALAAATAPVAQGDLDVRVPDSGRDELADLARAFNHMLEQLGHSRARIEFLKRIGEWQNMARRLAHEIKNPLTPIQLAVEECAGRYDGDDPRFRQLLDTTLDIVREEVASLRRLVTEFAAFARLPRATLVEEDLGDFLRDQLPRLTKDIEEDGGRLELDLREGAMPVALDRTMLYRVLSNLVANGLQAARETQGEDAEVALAVTKAGGNWSITVADNGPGIDAELRDTIFDPYVTTKEEGTGLGLTIVKKIVIDHGGQIEARSAASGGALFRILLPALGSTASEAALAQSEAAPVTG